MMSGASRRTKPSIALIGLRGSGKSTVGRELADLLCGSFVDIDDVIRETMGKPISDIFAEDGEERFRACERQAIARLCVSPPRVVAVGGGAVLSDENMRNLRSIATVVWLTAPPQTLWQRIRADRSTPTSRPPLTDKHGLDEVKALLAERTPLYEAAADLVIDTANRSVREVAQTIVAMDSSSRRED